jgi:EAL domain-containing protein (putative c-di-GMP-specific phosphodiesterase class I)
VVFSDTTGVADRESRLREHGRSLSLAARVRVAMAEDRLQIWGAPIHDMAGALVATRLTVRMPEPELSDTEFWAAVTSNGLVGDVEALVADAGGRLAAAGTQVAVSAGASSSIGARPQATPLVLGVGGAVPEADSRVDVLEVGAALISDPARHSEASAFVARAEALGFRTLVTGVDDSQTLAVADELGVDLIQGRLIGAPAPIRVPRWPLPPVGPGGR